MNKHEKKIEIIIGLDEQRKKGTARKAFCDVCQREVTKLPHEHDAKGKINPNKFRGI